jgi:hypothetical protein
VAQNNADSNADAYSHRNPTTDANSNRHANANPDTNCHANPDTDTNSNAYPYRHADTDCNTDSVTYLLSRDQPGWADHNYRRP